MNYPIPISFKKTIFALTLAGLMSGSSMVSADSGPLPAPTFAGGTQAITMTPIVGTPRRPYAPMFTPGEEKLEDNELRVTVLGSGNPWVTKAQAAASVLVEVGNPERDLLLFDIGSGALANFSSLKLPVNKLNKVFLSHLHADHTSDLQTLVGSYAKVGRKDGPVYLWGPSGSKPDLGTRSFAEGIEKSLAWDTAAGYGPINPESMKIVVSEFDWSKTQVVYDKNGVKVTAFPAIHAINGPVGYRLDFAGLSFAFSGDTRPGYPLVNVSKGVDLLIHECFPPPEVLAAESGLSIEQATIALNSAHTSPKGAGKVFSLVEPRMAGLWHTLLSNDTIPMIFSQVQEEYKGPLVQTQDFTVFNVTKEAVVVRQAKVANQLSAVPGVPTSIYKPFDPTPPEWWKNALVPLD
jgi:ribonuclease Z